MKRSVLLAALACAALLSPARAFSQTTAGDGFAAAVHAAGLRSDQRSIIDALLRGDPQAQDPNVRLEVIDVLEEDQRSRLFADLHWAQPDWSAYAWQNEGDRYAVEGGPVVAVVATAEPAQFTLQANPLPANVSQTNASQTNASQTNASPSSASQTNAPQTNVTPPIGTQINAAVRVTEHRGTVIEPTGVSIRAGMYLVVYGTQASDGSLSADHIDVLSDGLDLGY